MPNFFILGAVVIVAIIFIVVVNYLFNSRVPDLPLDHSLRQTATKKSFMVCGDIDGYIMPYATLPGDGAVNGFATELDAAAWIERYNGALTRFYIIPTWTKS